MLALTDELLPSWSFPLRIHPGELLSSWLSRSAHLHGTAPYVFLSIRLPGSHVWDRDVDRGASPVLLAALDRSAGLAPGRAVAASLFPWLGVLANAGVVDGAGVPRSHVPFLLSAGIHHRTRRLHHLQFCPACLREGEARFDRVGRLAFVVGCFRHGAAMRDSCPSCDAPVIFHRSPVGRLSACHACGADLAAAPEAPMSDFAAALALQGRCLAALEAGEATPDGLPCSGRDYLALVRTLAAVLVPHSGTPGADGRRQIERMRTVWRIPLLARLAGWTDEWPTSFGERAADLGLTRRSFLRLKQPPVLAAEVARLPDGQRRRRAGWRSTLDDAVMRRLRRDDESAYRTARAMRLLDASPVAAA